jgi:hypothetical protein
MHCTALLPFEAVFHMPVCKVSHSAAPLQAASLAMVAQSACSAARTAGLLAGLPATARGSARRVMKVKRHLLALPARLPARLVSVPMCV